MPTHAGKAGTTITGDFGGGRVGAISGTLGFALERRVSLMLTTMLIAVVGVNRTLLQRFLRGWAFTLRVLAGSVRESRRVLCCSCKSASLHTAPGKRRSA